MTLRSFFLAAVAAGSLIGTAQADETISLTPPLYRAQARATAALRPASELTTTPRPVPTAPATPRVVATAVPAR